MTTNSDARKRLAEKADPATDADTNMAAFGVVLDYLRHAEIGAPSFHAMGLANALAAADLIHAAGAQVPVADTETCAAEVIAAHGWVCNDESICLCGWQPEGYQQRIGDWDDERDYLWLDNEVTAQHAAHVAAALAAAVVLATPAPEVAECKCAPHHAIGWTVHESPCRFALAAEPARKDAATPAPEESPVEVVGKGCVPCGVCGGSQSRGWHLHDRSTPAPDTAAVEALARVVKVHGEYFDMDAEPWDAEPEPEDVWRYDRDFRAALAPRAATEGSE